MSIIEDFQSNNNNSIKILKYEFTGGNDLDFNPLNGESLKENDEYVGINPSNQITFEINGEKLYSKFMRIWDGPIRHGDYIFLSENKEFEKIDKKNFSYFDTFTIFPKKNSSIVNDLKSLEPFGKSNPEPIFYFKNIKSIKSEIMNKLHVQNIFKNKIF